MTVGYKVRNALSECTYGGDDRIFDCYSDTFDIAAKTDAEAIEVAERLQDEDDAKARKIIEDAEMSGESTYDLEESYNNAPCYVGHLWRYDDETDEEEQIEC